MMVEVIQGADLHDVEVFGMIDPFCVVEFHHDERESSPHKQHTYVVQNTVNPQWNTVHYFLVSDDCKSFKVEVKDKNMIHDDKLGHVLIARSIGDERFDRNGGWFALEHGRDGRVEVYYREMTLEEGLGRYHERRDDYDYEDHDRRHNERRSYDEYDDEYEHERRRSGSGDRRRSGSGEEEYYEHEHHHEHGHQQQHRQQSAQRLQDDRNRPMYDILEVVIHHGEDCHGGRLIGDPDLYAKITFDEHKENAVAPSKDIELRTMTVEKTHNPVWDATFHYLVENTVHHFTIHVMDEEMIHDSSLGHVKIAIGNVNEPQVEQRLALEHGRGNVVVTHCRIPMGIIFQ